MSTNMRPTATSVPRRTLVVVDRYEDAQEIVDQLSDAGFPVDHLTIVGRDLRIVEQVTGRLDWARAALGGLISGAFWGALFGLLFGVWFAHDGTSMLGILLYWILVGAVFGVIFALVGFALTRGRRNFTSVVGMNADRYEVLVDEPFADEALRQLAGLSRRSRTS
jgi:hypothetical protein